MTDQQKAEIEKAEQAWKEYDSQLFNDGIVIQKISETSRKKVISSLKRDIEKRIEELEQIALVSDSWHSVDIQISECKRVLELIETVEP